MNGLGGYAEPGGRQERRERRARLERERDAVRAQLAELRGRLPQLQRAGPSKGPSKQGGVSKKRPAAGDFALLSGDAKRQRVEVERAKRVNGIWQQCHTILKTLMKSKDAFAFSKPVNPIAAKCPDYHDIIKRPMDLGTIQKKFPGKGRHGEKRPEFREYKTPHEFRDDVRLVWANCRTYNAVGHAVRTMGDTLSETWEKKWALSGIEAKWDEEMRRQEMEEQELAGGANLAKQMATLGETLQQRVQLAESQPGYAPPQEGQAMNFEQKRRLSIALGQLPGDRIAEVMRIIAEDEAMRHKAESGEEVEVDIDQLSTAVLWKLDHFTTGVLQALKNKAGRKPEAQAKPAAAAAPNGAEAEVPNGGASGAGAAERSSSSSSSDSDTDRSASVSGGEVGSKDLGTSQQSGGAPAAQRQVPAARANDAATLVSATRPPAQAQIVKNMASKKEVNLQNANAWADLGSARAEDAGGAEEAAGEDEGGDMLWDEFKSREQEEEQREKEKRAEQERQALEQQKAEEAARASAERARQEAEAAEAAQRAEEEARINAQRVKEMEEMQKIGKGAEFAAGAKELLESKEENTLADVLGLRRKDSDSDDD